MSDTSVNTVNTTGLDIPSTSAHSSHNYSTPEQQLINDPPIFIDLRSLKYRSQPLDHLVCPICQSPFVNPYTTICGHTFCKFCIMESLKFGIHGGNGGEARGTEQLGEDGGCAGRCPLDRTCLWFDLDGGEFQQSHGDGDDIGGDSGTVVEEVLGFDVVSPEDTTTTTSDLQEGEAEEEEEEEGEGEQRDTTHRTRTEQQPRRENDIFPAPIIITNITDDLQVYCVNSERGCDWIGPRWAIKTHAISECEYTRFSCGKLKLDGTICDILTERRYLNGFKTIIDDNESNVNDAVKDACPHDLFPCEKCTELVSKVDLTWHLENQCEENKVKCNGCNLDIPFKGYENHEMVCEKVHIKCPGSSYGCDWRGRRDLLNEVHRRECVFVKLTGYFTKQQDKMDDLVNENNGLKSQLSTVLDSVIQGRLTNLGYSLQLEEVDSRVNNHNISNSSSSMTNNLFSRFANMSLQDEDYVHLVLEFERLRSDIDRIRPLLSEFEVNKQIVNTLMNENIQLKDEVNNHRVALNSVRQQIQFMLLERRRVVRSVSGNKIMGGGGGGGGGGNGDSTPNSSFTAGSRLKL